MRFLFLVFFIIISSHVFGQSFNIGVKAGINSSHLTGTFSPKIGIQYPKQGKLGAVFGAFGQYSLSEKFSLQTELLYSIEGEVYEYYSTQSGTTARESYDFTFYYVRIPIFLKYYPVRKFNIFAGPYVDYMIHANLRLEVETELTKDVLDTDINKAFSTWHYGISGGVGYEFDFGLSLDLRYTLGINDIVDLDVFVFTDTRQSILTLALGYH